MAQVAVFNINHKGDLVVRLTSSPTRQTLVDSQRRDIVLRTQKSLPKGHRVVGISNPLPSVYGQGGAYVFPVKITEQVPPPPPPPPEYKVEILPPAKTIFDLDLDDPFDQYDRPPYDHYNE